MGFVQIGGVFRDLWVSVRIGGVYRYLWVFVQIGGEDGDWLVLKGFVGVCTDCLGRWRFGGCL